MNRRFVPAGFNPFFDHLDGLLAEIAINVQLPPVSMRPRSSAMSWCASTWSETAAR